MGVPFDVNEIKVAWAYIRCSGVYVAIGYPRDPAVQDLLRIIRVLKSYIGVKRGRPNPPMTDCIESFIKLAKLSETPTPGLLKDSLYYPAASDLSALSRKKRLLTKSENRLAKRDAYLKRIFDQIWRVTSSHVKLPKWLLDSATLAAGLIPEGFGKAVAQWQNVGPDTFTGVVRSLAVHPSDSNRLYAGAELGGVWKTSDGALLGAPQWTKSSI